MAEKHTVAMFIQEDGERKQVGWASPQEEGVRTFEFSPGYSGENRPLLKNVSFEDDELSRKIAEEQAAAENADGTDGEEFEIVVDEDGDVADTIEENYPQAGDEGKDSAPIRVEANEEFASEPVENVGEETIELDNGGMITDIEENTQPTETDEVVHATNQPRRNNNKNRNRNNQNRQGGN